MFDVDARPFGSVLWSPTYAPSDRPQPLQQLAEGHLLRLHPHDHPPQGQRETSRPAHRHFGGEKRQLACWFLDGSSEMTAEQGWRGGDGSEGRQRWQAQLSGRINQLMTGSRLPCDAGGWMTETLRGWMLGQDAGSDDEDDTAVAATEGVSVDGERLLCRGTQRSGG